MPRELAEEGNAVQQQLIERLSRIRYNPPATTRVLRPTQNEKLPPGAAYGGVLDSSEEEEAEAGEAEMETPRGQRKRPAANSDSSSSSSSSDSDTSSSEEDEEERVSRQVKEIVRRLSSKKSSKRLHLDEPDQEEKDEEEVDEVEKEQEELGSDPPEYKPDSYIACIYENGWYVGQVMNKEGEPEADEREEYVLVSFMMWTGPKKDQLKWPERLDVLNVLKVGLYSTVPVPYHKVR
jgi:hypothetical protein